jgi:hypothetical protein
MGYCPPVGDILWHVSVSHPDYSEFDVGLREHADVARSSTNYDGPYVLRDICLTPKKR